MNPQELVAIKAKEWCDKHKGWIRICDIDTEKCPYDYTFEELSKKKKAPWIKKYGDSAEDYWNEFATDKGRYQEGFINGEGKFYASWKDFDLSTGFMMVFKVGKDYSKALKQTK